jgi:hypothetical protein
LVTFTEKYTTVDKTTWGEGPWQDEPDKVVWVDPATGLDCMAHRGPHGSWCGYVGVPKGHPAYGKHYDLVGVKDVDVDVHGGLTYSAYCQEAPPEHGICHVAQPGRPAKVWWLGFDCAHFMDFMPGMASRLAEIRKQRPDLEYIPDDPFGPQQYRDLAYVVDEVTSLAHQLA